jgi:CRISPR-associated endoribonuclease Cas6
MMDIPFSTTAPTRLYAILFKLRPLQQGTLMPFSGEFVQAALLNWLRSAAPDVAAWLHEGNKRRLFTCSSLQFPIPEPRMRQAERNNVHLPLDPEKTYTVRITLLLGELFPLFYDTLMHFNMTASGGQKPPFMQLGKQVFLLEEVITEPGDASGWADCTSFSKLVDWARTLRLGRVETLDLEFASLTTFNRSNKRSQVYGGHHALLPLPQYVFPGLVRRWQEFAPSELVHLVQSERIEQYIEDEGVVISDYDLKPHQVRFTQHVQPGFVGRCTYELRGPDEKVTGEAELTVRQQLLLLAQLAFYCGVGYKTAMGMGQVRLVELNKT